MLPFYTRDLKFVVDISDAIKLTWPWSLPYTYKLNAIQLYLGPRVNGEYLSYLPIPGFCGRYL